MAPLREEDEDINFVGTADIKGKDVERYVVRNTSMDKKSREANQIKIPNWKRGDRFTRPKVKRKKRQKPCQKKK